MTIRKLPAIELLLSKLRYNATTGELIWISHRRIASIGKTAYSPLNSNYWCTRIGSSVYLSHRLVWYMFYRKEPSDTLDHRDGNGRNNRIDNLREATQSQNSCNAKSKGSNTGIKGVYWSDRYQKYQVSICVNYVQKHIGYFVSLEEAIKAIKVAREQRHKEFTKHT